MKTQKITQILIVGIVCVFVILTVSALFNTENDPQKEEIIQRKDDVPTVSATSSIESLNKISEQSDLETDLDLYIESTEIMPNPNDFNDSYSDLKR
jgi:hypothetical protein